MERFFVATGLFKGQSLVEELAFVRYFHRHPGNVRMHLVGFPVTLFGALLVLSHVSVMGVRGHLLLAAIYVLGFLSLDRWVGVLYAFILGPMLLAVLWALEHAPVRGWIAGLVCLLIGLSIQVAGHVRHERALPAFRPFEAMFTTPFYLGLYPLMRLGYRRELDLRIDTLLPRWRGSERRVFD